MPHLIFTKYFFCVLLNQMVSWNRKLLSKYANIYVDEFEGALRLKCEPIQRDSLRIQCTEFQWLEVS